MVVMNQNKSGTDVNRLDFACSTCGAPLTGEETQLEQPSRCLACRAATAIATEDDAARARIATRTDRDEGSHDPLPPKNPVPISAARGQDDARFITLSFLAIFVLWVLVVFVGFVLLPAWLMRRF